MQLILFFRQIAILAQNRSKILVNGNLTHKCHVISYELDICSIDKTALPGNSDFATVSKFGKGWGDGRGVNIWGGRGFLMAMVHWYISNRLDGCVCNIRMPSVHPNHENAISGHCVLYLTQK